MKINTLIEMFEDVLNEISLAGQRESVRLSDRDYAQISKFLEEFIERADANGYDDVGLDAILSNFNIIRTSGAKGYLDGKSSEIPLSQANSDADREENLSHGFGPDKPRRANPHQKEMLELVRDALQASGFIGDTANIQDRGSIARVGDLLDKAKGLKYKTAQKAYQNFKHVVHEHKLSAEEEMNPAGPSSDEQMMQALSPNVLAFLAIVAKKNNSRKQSWDNYVNPKHYADTSKDPLTGYFQYDPNEAANDLVDAGLSVETDGKYKLNKEEIKKVLATFRSKLGALHKNARFYASDDNHGPLRPSEVQARQMISFVKENFSASVRQKAYNKMAELMQSQGGEAAAALRWYEKQKHETTQGASISGREAELAKTQIARAVDMVVAKIVVRMLDYYASVVLNEKPLKDHKSIVKPRDVQSIVGFFKKGTGLKKARV